MGKKKKSNVVVVGGDDDEENVEQPQSKTMETTSTNPSSNTNQPVVSNSIQSKSNENDDEDDEESGSGKTESKGKMQQRHRQELKDLKKKIEDIQKKATATEKKTMKETIKKLEQETEQRHQQELQSLDKPKSEETTSSSSTTTQSQSQGEEKMSKAKRKKAEKEAQEEAKAKEIAEQMKNRPRPDLAENLAFEKKLYPLGLRIKAIPSDGNCLFNAVADQLTKNSEGGLGATLGFDYYRTLRKKASDYMFQHKDEFMPFMEEGTMTEDKFREYCDKMANTAVWGGQMEIKALSHVLKQPITVVMAVGSNVEMGKEEFGEIAEPLLVSYHKFAFAAGEHYNSVVKQK